MPIDKRRKDWNWQLVQDDGESYPAESYAQPQMAVLMDIRDELKGVRRELSQLNSLLNCRNFIGIPTTLRTISRKLPPREKKR